ncbi:MAG TPA: type II toxin-antitoxin system VapC family toxin [Candidatus Acidoferrales bacterium]|nr:type II toxin-antitoxin system VapC family toxin [Candidatus Acidoferrales bacterium]
MDASALLEVLLQTPAAENINRLIYSRGEPLHAPHLIDLEIAQALRRYVKFAVISPDRAAEVIADFSEFPLTRHPHSVLLDRIWQMRHNLTAYDAAYLALAEALNARLVTRDGALAKFSGQVRVELV